MNTVNLGPVSVYTFAKKRIHRNQKNGSSSLLRWNRTSHGVNFFPTQKRGANE